MRKQNDIAHLAEWQDRLHDAIDNALDATAQDELRTHVEGCSLCREEQARLAALHSRLKLEFGSTPALRADFAVGVLARIDEQEQARRAAAKQRAEYEFNNRLHAFDLDWRELWQRHFGSIVAAVAALAAIFAAMGSTWESTRQQLTDGLHLPPWLLHEPAIAPVALTLAAVSIAAATLWWLRTKVF
jgi:hypothetical protein